MTQHREKGKKTSVSNFTVFEEKSCTAPVQRPGDCESQVVEVHVGGCICATASFSCQLALCSLNVPFRWLVVNAFCQLDGRGPKFNLILERMILPGRRFKSLMRFFAVRPRGAKHQRVHQWLLCFTGLQCPCIFRVKILVHDGIRVGQVVELVHL